MSKEENSRPEDGVTEMVRAKVLRAAWEVLAAIGPNACPMTGTIADADWKVTVVVEPVTTVYRAPPAPLTECERDIVRVLRGRTDYVTTGDMLRLLEEANLLHGESTMRHCLADMVRRGILGNRKRAPRGYHLLNDPGLDVAPPLPPAPPRANYHTSSNGAQRT